MSIKTCKQHRNDPIFIYAECAACEIQRYRNQVDDLKSENESLRNAVNIDIEAAAKMLAACMDYPWEHMPANGRDLMRRHAKDIVDAAISSPENPS